MELDRQTCDRARRSRDPRFDGRFFIAVTSTRIYCRPICPARAPKDEHIRYFSTAAAAEAAGFRPCLRCRPEAAPGTPAWFGTSSVVSRSLRLISDGALDEESVDRLAERVGVTARHLRRLFLQHLGATPLDVALTRRVHFAKKLLDETTLSCADVAFAAGFGSLRRFNGQIRRTYSRTPTELRRRARTAIAADPQSYRFRLTYRPPYDWDAALAFLRSQATPGVELVDGHTFHRTIEIDGAHGALEVSHLEARSALEVNVRFPDSRALLRIVERVRRMFDVAADPAVIGEHLSGDALIGPLLAKRPGIRVPGVWDGFEVAVRVLLDRFVPTGAAALSGDIASMFGTHVAYGTGLERAFPTPTQLAHAPLECIGLESAQAETLRALAQRTAHGLVVFDSRMDTRSAILALGALPGIDPGVAEYVVMRALGDPDAFLAHRSPPGEGRPSGDLRPRAAAVGLTTGELARRAEHWRPWRAYAAMLLWSAEDKVEDGAKRSWKVHHVQPAGGSVLRGRRARAADVVSASGPR